MSHLDEGTLHALLDGELDLAKVSEIQIHLGTCVACGSRLQEVRQVLAEADQLVGAVEMPAGAARPRPEPARRPPPPPPRPPRISDDWDQTPVLLLPDDGEATSWGTRWLRRLSWAAAIVVVVSIGRMMTRGNPDLPELTERDLTSATPAVPPAVVSPAESRRAVPPASPTRDKAARPLAQNRATQKATPKPAALRAEAPVADTPGENGIIATSGQDTVAADSQTLADEGAAADTGTKVAVAAGAPTDSVSEAKSPQDNESREEQDLATRRAAAMAMAELDRERLKERAKAATAALPPPRAPEAPAAAESTPRPLTLEQRSQVYLRIGLDEAAKQLGQPVHVIEGMTPQFIGLTRAPILPGSNSRRPVVRVVYLDQRGRMILLDQQRVDSGDATPSPAGSMRWVIGDVMLYLRGEPSPDVLRSMRDRVR